MALLDCGLMATIDREDQDHMISAVIHLANKDYASLVDDFINLKILPEDCDRPAIIPLMDKALSPYVKVSVLSISTVLQIIFDGHLTFISYRVVAPRSMRLSLKRCMAWKTTLQALSADFRR